MNQSTTRRTFLRATGVTTLLAGTSPLLAWEQVCETHNLTNTAFTTLKNQLTAGSPAGKLILPSDTTDYATARLSQHINFNGVFPVGIAQCATSDHVKHCIAFAKQHGLELVIRGGGHSYEGYCVTGGLILDVSPMNDIQVNQTTNIATVGAGCNLWKLYTDLANLTPQLSFPGGTCPTVGVSGFLLGGGMGFQDRTYGMGCDRVVGVTVVTADGDVLTADKNQNTELFWACCGGGGGNFGVVTQFKLQCHPMSHVQWKAASWPIANPGSDPTDDEPDVSHAVTVFQAYVAWLNTEQVAGVTDLSGENNPSGGKSSMMNTAFEIKSGYWWTGHPGPGQCLLTMQYYDEHDQSGTSTAAVDTALAGLLEMIKQKDPTISAPDLAHPPYPLTEILKTQQLWRHINITLPVILSVVATIPNSKP